MSLSVEKKYFFYENSVQGPEFDIKFIEKEYKRFYGPSLTPLSLREDFGGTGFLCCEWVKSSSKRTAMAVDLDPEPIEYGKKIHFSLLNPLQKERMLYLKKDVTKITQSQSDIIVAFNFSYFIFKERKSLLTYFKAVKKSMSKKGIFVLDILGGSDCFLPNKTTTRHSTHHYIWELNNYNPINNHLDYSIHFFDKKKKKMHKKVFHYDWRLWSTPEIYDLLKEAGFKEITTYWEGTDQSGGGNGIFRPKHRVEFCQSWVSYIVAIP